MTIDVYLASSDLDSMRIFCSLFSNVIGPLQGRSAVESYVEDDGMIVIPAVPAAGDPALWYAAIRSDQELTLPDGIFACDAVIGQSVLGVWL